MAELTPDSPVIALKGAGPRRAACYARLSVATVGDLCRMYPRTYVDFSRALSVSDTPLNEVSVVRVTVRRHRTPVRTGSGLTIFTVETYDDSAGLEVVFFNAKFRAEALEEGKSYYLRGKVEGNLFKKKMSGPMVLQADSDRSLTPVYPLTEGLSNNAVMTNMRQALEVVLPLTRETLPGEALSRFNLTDARTALRDIHLPADLSALEAARRRMIFEELLATGLGLRMLGEQQKVPVSAPCHAVPLRDWYAALPYSLTGAQRRCICEIQTDMCRPTPMNRLMQGDVGSGKTVVAACAAYFAALNGYQTALLAPTELLAEQHLRSLEPLFASRGMRVGLLTGSTKKADRDRLLSDLSAGEITLLVGTHALMEEDVRFRALGLVVTDEQHRFGVMQRTRMYHKGEAPHLLVMSATPIPRTLALMLYGDLSLSALDELPPGRLPVRTRRIRSSQWETVREWLRGLLREGQQAYVVCPSIEESELTDMAAATAIFQQLRGEFPEFGVELLHGRMKSAEKADIMTRFTQNQVGILVSTTVIEVGVDVPNATVMLVENAERFGLSQLHQLRGRVGRGKRQSYCLLLSDSRGEDAEARLAAMESTQNGFEIAEQDLKLRGPGDFFGSRQSGIPTLQLANLLTDMELTGQVAAYCDELLQDDPGLEAPEHQGCREMASRMLEKAGTLN